MLAYVYTRDGLLVNSEMIKRGYAMVQATEQFRLIDDFRSYERDAMQAMRGVWGLDTSSSSTASTQTPHPDRREAQEAQPADAFRDRPESARAFRLVRSHDARHVV